MTTRIHQHDRDCACDEVGVDGDGQHFGTDRQLRVEGLSRIKRHQLVYGALGDRMRAEIHALSMQTLTPAERDRG
jgi:acid stress-induced BolA-like protein IbaG/YrbA